MSENPFKNTAEWFYNTIFRDESIRPRHDIPKHKLPSLLRAARSLEDRPRSSWQSKTSLFLKQAKLLANYEDDFEFNEQIRLYFPTYHDLSNKELRGYFSWRTKLRHGQYLPTCASFAYLYLYELINQIGVADAMDGYRKLRAFEANYPDVQEIMQFHLDGWIRDFVVYYGLDASLLSESEQVLFDRSLWVLDHIQGESVPAVVGAVKRVAPKWLARSKFYGTHGEEFDEILVRILRRFSQHYAKQTKQTMVEHYFGRCVPHAVSVFSSAIFSDPLKIRNYEYRVDERFQYLCKNGTWTAVFTPCSSEPNRKLEALMKTIDGVMREEYGDKHPIQYESETQWQLKIIREEIRLYRSEKQAAEAKKITIDYSQLAKIRKDAAKTQKKLTVEDELEPDIIPAGEPRPSVVSPPPTEPPVPAEIVQEPDDALPLSQPELRLLRCLLYGGSLDWIAREGHLTSVLVDGINEKMYDTFQDTVLDDTPAPLEDYIEELKEMVHP